MCGLARRWISRIINLRGNNLTWVDNSVYPPPNKAISVYYFAFVQYRQIEHPVRLIVV
jgi:hypothetical protein